MKRRMTEVLLVIFWSGLAYGGWEPATSLRVERHRVDILFGGRGNESVRLEKRNGRYTLSLILGEELEREVALPPALYLELYRRIYTAFQHAKRQEATTLYCSSSLGVRVRDEHRDSTDTLCLDPLSAREIRGFAQWYSAVRVLR